MPPTPEEVRDAGLQAMIDALLAGAGGETPNPEAVAHAQAIADLMDDPAAVADLTADGVSENPTETPTGPNP